MTSLEKRQALDRFCTIHICRGNCPLFTDEFRCGRGDTFMAEYGEDGYMSDYLINAAYGIAFPESNTVPIIKDSGERREFDTGAVRDIQEGKGRCDLMPLDVVAASMCDPIIGNLAEFQLTGACPHLHIALDTFCGRSDFEVKPTLFLEVSKHFEEGAKKYGEHNWQKGIPVRCYIDSAVRHYLKWLRDDKDEPHDRAFCWNIICAIWTCKHMPNLNDYEEN